MFVLAEFKDTVRTPPQDFNQDFSISIAKYLNDKLSNKVVKDVGLCIALFDILKFGDSFIVPGDGAHHTKVEFRFVIFRPFMEEILFGKIKNCSKDGVYVTLGFFDDIIIPPNCLQHPSRYDEAEEVWIWEFDNDGDKHDLFMDKGETVKMRITSEEFQEVSPVPSAELPDRPKGAPPEEKEPTTIPYSLTATINEPGLGLLTWWDGSG